ncbi:Acetyl esterase Axe7A precursor [Limihaloglobus sulfuriphilus]|uniref:Acetyl esterase Axe7A n=1 Tax=Limihaloglobus sulfuriphilus TaxID=1851148 RepID=A0A1Q2MBE2_9BACT|nr:acetylxylan esterase [Limihaloglobus sulfuriphilus]AQQ70045.1 Acetyl esterase Axe7A precursor [Limihaloglobus sulfuriphilus]
MSNSSLYAFAVLFLVGSVCVFGQGRVPASGGGLETGLVWDVDNLKSQPVRTWPDTDWQVDGVKSLYYCGLDYKGRPTRVFAYLGVPKGASVEKPVPGVVCVHGGGGTAFAEWVKIWNQRGYAAISMDVEGQVPDKQDDRHRRPQHNWHGPRRAGIFDDIRENIEDQWMFHAVADVILANTLLGSMPEVDGERVGLTGISWGGVISSIVVGVDDRFAFAAIVYGCGYLFEAQNHYTTAYEGMGQQLAPKCRNLWDGSSYLVNADMPILWLNGVNDNHFPPPIFNKCYLDTKDSAVMSMQLDLKHSHQHGWAPEEIYAFADSIAKNGKPLPRVIETGKNGEVWVRFSGENPPVKAELIYTCDEENSWPQKQWISKECRMSKNKASIKLPDGVVSYYFNLTDRDGHIVSSEIKFQMDRN